MRSMASEPLIFEIHQPCRVLEAALPVEGDDEARVFVGTYSRLLARVFPLHRG